MNNKKRNGISLIVLVITIIVIIILAGAVILSLANNNPIAQATKSVYLSDVRNFQTELEFYKTQKFSETLGAYNAALLDANLTSITYNGVVDNTKTILDIIPSLKTKTEYSGDFEIIDGSLIFIGADSNEKDWAAEIDIGTDLTAPSNPTITISPSTWTNGNVTVTATYPGDAEVKEYSTNGSTWVAYTAPITVTTNNAVTYARAKDRAGNVSGQTTLTVTNIDKTAPTVTPSNGGSTSSSVTITATSSDTGGSGLSATCYQYSKDNGTTWTTATSAATYTFTGLTTGTYQCKVKVVDNAANSTTSAAVAITTQAVGTITLAKSTSAWTNGNVTVTITYPAAVTTKQYSLDGTTWNTYSAAIVVSTNNTTVYAKGTDVAGNAASQVSVAVTNIDKTAPTVTATSGGATTTSITVNATASDAGGSALNTASYQYSSDNGVTWTAATSATTYTFSGIAAGTYQCKVKVADTAGNSTTSAAVAITRL